MLRPTTTPVGTSLYLDGTDHVYMATDPDTRSAKFSHPLSFPATTTAIAASSASARPWVVSIVFKIDPDGSSQRLVWCAGKEPTSSGSTTGSILLKLVTHHRLQLLYGSTGAHAVLNMGEMPTGRWLGVTVAHNGHRRGPGNDATNTGLTRANLNDTWVQIERRFHPDPARHELYRDYYRIYRDLYPHTVEDVHALARLGSEA